MGWGLSSTQCLCPCTALAQKLLTFQKLVLGLDSVTPSKEDGESLIHSVALFGNRVFFRVNQVNIFSLWLSSNRTGVLIKMGI